MKLVTLATLASTAAAFAPVSKTTSSIALSESKVDLEVLAEGLNPLVKYWDPLNIAEQELLGTPEATIAWFRQAEIKHGRVAMAAFVGYCVQSNFVFPWAQGLDGHMAPSIDLTPEAQWDEIPVEAKVQILVVIGFLEMFDETGGGGVLPHYTDGRKPGMYPSLSENFPLHFTLDLYDPFGFSKNRSEEDKAAGLLAEINNGRLAMLGIFGFLVENKVPGAVPLLGSLGACPGYAGEPMSPFEGQIDVFVK